MFIEKTGYYKLRNGNKAHVVAILDDSEALLGGETVITVDRSVAAGVEQRWLHSHCRDGRFTQTGGESALDIVSEWREPVTIERYVSLFEDGRAYIHHLPGSFSKGKGFVREIHIKEQV